NHSLSDEQKEKQKGERQQLCDTQAERIHNISQLLRAYCLFEKDVQYVVEEKEAVQIDRETQTLATITIQNYFRLYQKLAGMTGTAETEANEFHDIYK